MGIFKSIKQFLLKVYNYPLLSKAETNVNQKKIRDTEWSAIAPFITEKSVFLDVGCGAGYAMHRAATEKKCTIFGIDPDPGGHGVGRTGSGYALPVENIKQAFAESIPFESSKFNVVYSSHVLEHVNSELKSLQEMKRVLTDDGTLIIGMPTASMAWISLITQLIFTTHHRFVNFFLSPFIKTGKIKFWQVFIPVSHSYDSRTVFYDIRHYKTENWKKIVSQEFIVEKTILPALYPYPEYRQFFSMKSNGKRSSSVFFICKKKTS
jgi:ubiquinone/menaquinone biosynthesis C-methylase UbiE